MTDRERQLFINSLSSKNLEELQRELKYYKYQIDFHNRIRSSIFCIHEENLDESRLDRMISDANECIHIIKSKLH